VAGPTDGLPRWRRNGVGPLGRQMEFTGSEFSLRCCQGLSGAGKFCAAFADCPDWRRSWRNEQGALLYSEIRPASLTAGMTSVIGPETGPNGSLLIQLDICSRSHCRWDGKAHSVSSVHDWKFLVRRLFNDPLCSPQVRYRDGHAN
jgi:ribosomal protein L31